MKSRRPRCSPNSTSDYDERTKLVAARYFFGVCGGIGMTIVTFGYFLQPTPEAARRPSQRGRLCHLCVVAAAVMLVAVLISSFGTQKERLNARRRRQRSSCRSGRCCARCSAYWCTPPYVSILLASLFFAVASGAQHVACGLFLDLFLGIELHPDRHRGIEPASSAIILAFVVVLPLSARFGKKPSAMLMFSLSLISSVHALDLAPRRTVPGQW